MNKQCYRLVFSRVRGMLVAVAEIVASEGKSPGESRATKRRESRVGSQLAAMAYGATAVIGGAMLAPMPSYSQTIVADPNAPANQRPTIGASQNGVPIVNIQGPSKAGVSRNTYSQFDVQQPGVILNNSTKNVQQTELGGMIRGNAQLKGRNARVILNEVNSQDPSQLRGQIEVAGQRAQVIIANPAGVSCEGCGFINVTRGTLTTGTPIVNDGALQGYLVRGGTVRIDGAGLDASRTDYAEIISRAVEINANIFANELGITAGANQVAVDGRVTPIEGQGSAPMVAIDVSQLGGMYAGKIMLVGTEAGVGVRNAGNIGASVGEVVLTLEGRLINSGNITATGEIRADARSGIDNEGMLYAQNNVQLLTLGDIDNRGVIASGKDTTLAANGVASRILNRSGALAAAGLASNGDVGSTGRLSLRADGAITSAGDTLAGGEQRLTASQVDLTGGRASAQALIVSASGAVRTDAAQLTANRVELSAQSLSNVRGQIAQLGDGRLGLAILGAFDNQEGLVLADSALQVNAGSIANRDGTIGSQQSTVELASGELVNAGGSVQSKSALSVKSGVLDNDRGLIQSQAAVTIDTQGKKLVNTNSGASGGIVSQGALALASGDLDNTAGTVISGDALQLQAQALDNRQGMIGSGGALEARVQSFDNRAGALEGQQAVSLIIDGLLANAEGRLQGRGPLRLTAQTVSNTTGRIESAQALSLSAVGLTNTDGVVSGGQVDLDTRERMLDNQRGRIVASEALTVRSGTLVNSAGLLQSQGSLTIDTNGQSLVNTNSGATGGILSEGFLALTAGDLDNTAGYIGTNGPLRLQARTIDNRAGTLSSSESLAAAGRSLDNRGGVVQSNGDVGLTLSGALDNTGSAIRAGGALSALAEKITNANTREGAGQGLQGASVVLDARTIENTAGAIRASDTLTARASGGTDTAAAFTNTGGTLMAGRALTIEGESLSSDGQLLSLGDLSIVLDRDYVHRGELLADGTVRIELRGKLLNQASLQGGQGLVVKAANIENTADGELSSGGKTEVTANQTLTNRGLIDGRETVVRAEALTNLGRIYGDTLGVDAGALSNVGGTGAAPVIAARESLNVGARTIDNREHGLIFSAGDLAIGGSLDANGNVVGQAQRLNNASATIEALGSGRIAARLIDNTNEHFSTSQVVVGQERVQEFQADGQDRRYSAADGAYVYRSSKGGYRLHTPEANVKRYKEYDYTRTTTETQVATSDAGQILAGGDLSLAGETVRNDKSLIVAGSTLTATAGKLENTEVFGERRVNEQGTVADVRSKVSSTRKKIEAYNTPEQVEAIKLEATVYQGNTAVQGSGTQLAARSVGQVTEKAITEITALDRTDVVVRSVTVTPTLPSSQLFTVSPKGDTLIATDARFGAASQVNTRDLLKNVALDATKTQTRLGDGLYEQRLIREQVVALTGQRYLQGFGSDEQQYAGLLSRGAAFSQAQGVRLGEGLTAAQMAQLTDDVVLLVEQSVTLPDGSTTRALVPKVYARASTGAVRPSQALVSGGDVQLNLSGDLFNNGTLTARNVVEVSADNVNNVAGRIQANAIALSSRGDINYVSGGRIAAQEYLQVAAGRDLNIASTTKSEANTSKQFGVTTTTTLTRIDQVGSLEVTGENGTLIASAGRDVNLTAAALVNRGNGGTLVSAGNDVSFKTLTESSSREVSRKNYYRRDAETREAGTQIQSIGDLIVRAGRDVNARAVELTSSEGALQVQADRDVNLSAGEATSDYYQKTVTKKKKTLSTKTTTRIDSLETTTAQGSSLSGVTSEVIAGQDIQLTGSSVVSDQATALRAGRDITAEAAIETREEGHYKKVKKSGVFSGGTFAVTAGQKKLTQDQKAVSTAVAASTVGSTLGDVIIRAGQQYTQVGSDLLTPAGSVDVEAQKLLVKEARATSRTVTETKQQQAGLTLGLTGGVVAAIEKVQQTVDSFSQLKDASENTSSSRMKALAGATAALQAKGVYDSIEQSPAPDAQQALGVSVAISIGASSSSSKSTEASDNAIGSQIVAAGSGRFVATGAGANSDLTIQGSTVRLGGMGEIASDGTLNLQAAQNTASLKSTNKSAGGSVGISIGTTTGITASASIGRGKANGKDETYTNTVIQAGEGLTLQSGGDVTLKGAVISADQVAGTIGGNLVIESLQDKSTYESKQMTAGLSVTYGFSADSSVSGSFSQSKINSDYLSVKEQSGIRAGDGGFQLNVLGNTDLKGGAITSTEAAVAAGKNSFSTAGLTMSDVDNHAEYKAKSMGFSAGSGAGGGGGFGKDADNAKSLTRAGISGYAGDLVARTGDAESGIPKIFDVNKVQRELDAQVTITRAFGQVAPKAVADFADRQTQRYSKAKLAKEGIESELANETDPARRAQLEQARDEANQYLVANQADYEKWREGGVYRVALHAALGGLAAGYTGALGAGAAASAAPAFNELQDRLERSLSNAGVKDEVALGIARLITGATAAGVGGALTGGDFAGSGQALNVDSNNRQLHEEEITRIRRLAKDFAKKEKVSEEEATRRLTQQALRQVDFLQRAVLSDGDDQAAQAFLATTDTFTNDLGEQQALFTVSGQQLFRPEMYADTADPSFYKRYAQPGARRDLIQGLSKETKDLGKELKDGVVSAGKAVANDPLGAAKALGNAVTELPGAIIDGFTETGHALGEGAAVAFNDDLGDKLTTIYGTDVRGTQGTLLGLRAVTAVAGATGTAKAVGKTGEKLSDSVKGRIEANEVKKAKEKEFAERKEKLNSEKDSFEVENAPVQRPESDFVATSDGQIVDFRTVDPSKIPGKERELQVAEMTGGRLAGRSRIDKNGNLFIEDELIRVRGEVVTGIDLYGENGELIQVGGIGKIATPKLLEKTKRALTALRNEAQRRGTKAQVYYEHNASLDFQRLLQESQTILGKENVFVFGAKH